MSVMHDSDRMMAGENLRAAICAMALLFTPGSNVSYSSAGFHLLSVIVEQARTHPHHNVSSTEISERLRVLVIPGPSPGRRFPYTSAIMSSQRLGWVIRRWVFPAIVRLIARLR